MATTDFNELKAVVTKSLETSGVLSQIRAHLRASVYQAIHQPGKSHGSQLLDGLSAALCAELIAEFFEFHGFQHSLRVFQTEAQLTLARRGRSDVAADAGLRAVMVGCSILEQLLGRRQEPDSSDKTDTQKQPLQAEDQGRGQADESTNGWRRQKPPDLQVVDEQLAESAGGCSQQQSAQPATDSTHRQRAEHEQHAEQFAGLLHEKAAEALSMPAPHEGRPAESGHELDQKEETRNFADEEEIERAGMAKEPELEREMRMERQLQPERERNERDSVERERAEMTDGVASAHTASQRIPGALTLTATTHGSGTMSPAGAHGTLRGSHMRLPPLGESAPGLPPPVGTRLAPLSSPMSSSASIVQAGSQGTPPQTPSGTMSPSGTGTPAGILSPAGSSATLGNSLVEEGRGSFGSLGRAGNPLPPLSAGISGSAEVSAVKPGRRRVKEKAAEKDSKRAPDRTDWSLQHDSSASTMDATGADASSVTSGPQISAASRLAKALKGTAAAVATGSESDEEGYSEPFEDALGTSASCDSFPPGPLSLMRQGSESVSIVDSVSGADASLSAMDEEGFEQ